MKQIFVLAVIAVTLVTARPANDWNKPCFDGKCAYDLISSAGEGSGTLKIYGSPSAISDITPAAGWIILGCNPNALAQDIRLVCKSHDGAAAGCDHLFQDSGPVDKLVRLPDSCGKSAFARISKSWVPKDQSIPSSVHGQISRRDGMAPQVVALSLDTDFDKVDASKTGVVSFFLQGANIPGAEGDFSVTHAALQSRDGGDFVETALERIANWSFDKHTDISPINFDKNVNILDQKLTCGPIQGSIKIDVGGKAHVVVSVGIAASGNIFPPKISSFGAYAGVTADLEGSVDLAASLSGTLSVEKTLFKQGLPGLSFPAIFSIGPAIELIGQAKANLELDMDLKVGVNYHIEKAQLYFPSSAGKSGGGFELRDTPLKLSASPSVKAKGSIEAHLIPRIVLGVSALLDSVKAEAYLALDASAKLSLDAHASTTVGTKDQKELEGSSPGLIESGISSAVKERSYVPPYGARNAPSYNHVAITPNVVAIRNPSSPAEFGGCVDLVVGLNVYAGAEGKFFSFFDANTKVDIFKKDWELFKKCFGSAQKRMTSSVLPRSLLEIRATELSCPGSGVSKPVAVADESVKAASAKGV